MSSSDEIFRDLELLNIKIDVWIDEEDYNGIYDCIKPNPDLNSHIVKLFEDRLQNEDLNQELRSTFTNNPERSIQVIEPQKEKEFNSKEINLWKPLFLAKYLRARIMENGTQDYTEHLKDLLIYLQRKLPYQYPIEDNEIVLQHLYFQELSASGNPGLESLGFAVRTHDLLDRRDERIERGNHFSFKLYKLWAKLNQGIGYWHSNQKMQAALAFNEIIREFEGNAKCLQADEKSLWQNLIFDPAILFKAEIQEDLQFSYHTLKTLTKLNNDRTKERRLIKEALAYRDIGRLEEAKCKIKKLLGCHNNNHLDSTKKTFDQFDRWETGKKKNNIWTRTRGLLFDYYLQEFEENDQETTEEDVESLVEKFNYYKERLKHSKPERVSYYQQVARYLKWLATSKNNYTSQISQLYNQIKEELPGIKESRNKQDQGKGIKLHEFGKYEYDRFTDSMEKFYKAIDKLENNHARIVCHKDEIKFLEELNDFEERKFWLYGFKKLERNQRINWLEKRTDDCTEGKLKCFNEDDSAAFGGILNCVKESNRYELSEYLDTRIKPLVAYDYETIMRKENNRFLEYLKFRSKHPQTGSKNSFHFMGLQRWNSQTPTLTLSQGGGYFIYEQDDKGVVILGIAIDPGFDFIDNLFHMGFTINDIDFILISHAHLDHMRDFEPIISSLLDLKKRTPDKSKKKKIHVMMSLGVYRRLENIITNTTLREYLADTYIVDIDKEIHPDDYLRSFRFNKKKDSKNEFISILEDDNSEHEIEIRPTKAYHDDYSERSDSFGYVIDFMDKGNKKPLFSFGYTGDTKWHEDIASQYAHCDVICIHLGALIESNKKDKDEFAYYAGPECEALIEKKGHPYLFGLLRFLREIKGTKNQNKLILISEFGEELKGGIRIDLIHRLNQIFKNDNRICLPVDIGLNVILAKDSNNTKPNEAWCFGCEDFVEVEKIGYRHFGYGRDEALFYFCDTCLKSKPENFIQEKMRSICASGIPLKKDEEFNK